MNTKPFRIGGFIAIIFLLVIFTPLFSFAAVGINAQIPFEGTLKNSRGTALTGTYDMIFKIYDAPTDGTVLWGGTYNDVSVSHGSFSVMLGSGGYDFQSAGIDFNDDSYYLGVSIGSDPEMTPREHIGASGYAINSDMLDGLDSSTFLQSGIPLVLDATSVSPLLSLNQNGDGNIMSAFAEGDEVFSILKNGNVGIGIPSPESKLAVNGEVRASNFLSTEDITNTFAGRLNIQSGDPSSFDAGIQIGAGSYLSFGGDSSGINFGGEGSGINFVSEVSGLTLFQDINNYGPNDLFFGLRGDAEIANLVNIVAPGELRLTANNDNGPTLELNADGSASMHSLNGFFGIDFLNGVQVMEGNLSVSGGGNLSVVDGFLGVGTTTPSVALDVVGAIHATQLQIDADAQFVDLGGAGEMPLQVRNDGTIFASSVFNEDVQLPHSNLLLGDGFVGIGVPDPQVALDVGGIIRSSGLADPVNPTIDGMDEAIYADGLGNIHRGTPAPGSDIRLKKNVETIDGALESVLKLRGVSYEWKDPARFGSQKEIGFIAQEIQQVLPDVVRPNGEYFGVKIQNVVAVVVEAIKELNTKVSDYFARTEKLEREVADLRSEIEILKGNANTHSESAPKEEVVAVATSTPEESGTATSSEDVSVIEEPIVPPVVQSPADETTYVAE